MQALALEIFRNLPGDFLNALLDCGAANENLEMIAPFF
jgi:hypothetical protein